jgi:hypothetical protein
MLKGDKWTATSGPLSKGEAQCEGRKKPHRSSSELAGFLDYSEVAMLGVWYKSVIFGAGRSLDSPNWSDQLD